MTPPVTPEAAVERPREADCGEAEVFVGEVDFLVGDMVEEVVDKGTGEISMLLATAAGLAAFNARRGGEGGWRSMGGKRCCEREGVFGWSISIAISVFTFSF
jgi:hypothetical protein